MALSFALLLLVDFSALEALAGIQSMGGEGDWGAYSSASSLLQWNGETEFLSYSPSSLQLPILLFLDPGLSHFFFFFFWCVLLALFTPL